MSYHSNTKTILLVEDEALIAMGTKMTLEKNGYFVIHTINGEKAVEIVREKDIALILMDIDLGKGMDGTEAAEKILEKHTVPIIFHTSHSEKEMVEKVKGITRYGYVLKNAGEFVLLESIQMAFELFEAKEEAQRNEQMLKTALDNSHAGVAIADAPDGKLTYVNDAGLMIRGGEREKVVNGIGVDQYVSSWQILDLDGKPLQTDEVPLARAVKYGETNSRDFIVRRDNQEDRIVNANAAPVFDKNGNVESAIVIFLDVTEQKAVKNELQCLYEISKLVEYEGVNLTGILKGTAELIPKYIGKTGDVSVRIVIDDIVYTADNFTLSERKKFFPISLHGKPAGQLEVYCNAKSNECKNEMFLPEFDSFLEAITERVGRILERYKVQEKYKVVSESLHEAILQADNMGVITYANSKAAELCGMEGAAELLGIKITDLYTTPQRRSEYIDELQRKGYYHNLEFDLKRKDGTVVPTLCNIRLLRDEEGNYTGTLGALRDVSEIKRLTDELRESREYFETVLHSIGDGVAATDRKGKLTLLNPVASELTGYTMEDAVGKPFTTVFSMHDSETKQPIEDPIATVLSTGKTIELSNHTELVTKEGSAFHIADSAAPIRKESGEINGAVIVFRDETEKYELEREQQEHFRLIEGVFHAIQDSITVINPSLTILKANTGTNELFDSKGNLTGKKCYKTFFNRSEPCTVCPVKNAFKTKQLAQEEITVSPNGNKEKVFEAIAYPVIDEMGEVEKVVEYCRDVTEKKQAEEELQTSKNRFQALFNNTSVMLVIDPETGKILHANASAVEFYGYSYEEITTMGIQDINTLSEEEVKQEMAAAAAAKKTYFNFQHRLATGEVRDVEVYSGKVGWGEKDVLCSVIHDVTEKKQAEEQNRKHVRRLDMIMQTAHIAWWEMDVRDGSVHFNDQKAEMLGYTAGQFKHYQDFMDLVHPDDYESTMDAMRKHFTGEAERYECEYRIQTKSGEYKWFRDVGSVTERDGDGKPVKAAGIVIDISVRKESEEKHKRLVDNSPSIICEVDADSFEVITCNPAMANSLGQNGEDLIGKGIDELLPPDIVQTRVEYGEKALRTNTVQRFEDERNGRYFLNNFIPHFQEGKRIVQTVTYDITDLRIAQKNLSENLEILNNITDNMFDMVSLVNVEGKFIYASPSHEKILGYTPDFLKGRNMVEFVHPDDLEETLAAISNLKEGYSTVKHELRYRKEEGEYIWIEAIGKAQKNESNTISRMIISSRDITDRKQIDKKLSQLAREREMLLKEMNHRVKNNLAMVSALINLKEDDLEGSVDLSDLVRRIATIRLIHEHMHQSEKVTHINLEKYLKDIADGVVTLVNKKIEVNITSEIKQIQAHSAISVGLIVNELVTNAMKYGMVDQEKLTISVHVQNDTDLCVLTFSNNGKPFPADVSLDNPETLGLRLISALVGQLQGTIELQRKPHPVFTIRFPLEKE